MSSHLTIQFLGAAGTVTGSKYLLTWANRHILVDAGQFQGKKSLRLLNWQRFPINPASITDILVTHAHLDHVGYLPALVKQGFRGKIWATKPTIELSKIVLRDAAHLQEQDARDAKKGGYSKHENPKPLFDNDDVDNTLPLFTAFPLHQEVDLGDQLRVEATRAGHILGSVSYRVWLEGARSGEDEIIFSGDLGRADHPVLADRESPRGAATLLIESTYGDRLHPKAEVEYEVLADVIRRTIGRGGNVLIPAFAVDRTEIILHVISQLIKQGRIPSDMPIWVNSPMGLAALGVYTNPDYQDEIGSEFKDGQFFDLPTLKEARSQEESLRLNNPAEPSIIISSSGMATGGRIVHHLRYMLPNSANSVVFTGYQAVGTRGRVLIEGAKQIKMYGQYIPVRAEIVQSAEFSVHADAKDLMDWLGSIKPRPKTVYCVHGEPDSSRALAAKISEELQIMAIVPTMEEIVRV